MKLGLIAALLLPAAVLLGADRVAAQADALTLTRASQGERVAIWQNHVKADERQDFEEYLRFFWSGAEAAEAAGKLSGKERAAFRSVRVLFPVDAEADGTYTYTFVADPYIEDADYTMATYLRAAYPEERVRELLDLLEGALARDQTFLYGIQRRH